MNIRSPLLLAALAVVLGVAPALAQPRHSVTPNCVNNYPQRSILGTLFSTGPAPQGNGCAPAVYSNGGRFIGQDPDPNVRLQLLRDADNEGYHMNTR